jgi:polysaccharide export outer membrane protein
MQGKIFGRTLVARSTPRNILAVTTMLIISLLGCAGEQQMSTPFKSAPRSNKRAVYRISPGDQLALKFYYHPELNTEAWVRPDGFISLELIGEIKAAGQTPTSLDSLVEFRYERYIKQPEAVVIVKNSAAQKVFVGGEVQKPQMLTLNGDLSLIGSIFQAEGFKPSANPSKVILLRNDPQRGPMILRVDVKSALQGRNPEANLPLQPYDVVYVPKSGIAKADLFVTQFIENLLPTQTINGFAYIYFLVRR